MGSTSSILLSTNLPQDDCASVAWEDLFNRTPLNALMDDLWPVELLFIEASKGIRAFKLKSHRVEAVGTLRHQLNVAVLCVALGRHWGLSEKKLKRLYIAALFHDVGKFSLDPYIIFKPGNFDHKEFKEIMRHPKLSYEIIRQLFSGPEGKEIAEIARHHHERPDAKGYPDKLRAKDISIESQLLRGIDGYDAMIRKRCHRNPLSTQKAKRILSDGRGKSYVPSVINTVLSFLDVVPLPIMHNPVIEDRLRLLAQNTCHTGPHPVSPISQLWQRNLRFAPPELRF